MADRYILVNGEPVEADDLHGWARWYEAHSDERVVQQDIVGDGVKVSTVFLGLNHNFGKDGPPVLWETMIFGGPHDEYQQRYTSKADALAGHATALWLAKA